VEIVIDLGVGGAGEITIYTTDLSHDYVEENSAYSS
jgi:glutamate N-acetyltransferase/amino-acid N-acetyltransferase